MWGWWQLQGSQEATNALPPFKSPFSAAHTDPNCGGPVRIGGEDEDLAGGARCGQWVSSH